MIAFLIPSHARPAGPPATPGMLPVLAALDDMHAAGGGWFYHGVRGWLFPDEVEVVAGRPSGAALAALVDRGLAGRADLRPPHSSEALWLYRITGGGAALLAGRGNTAVRAVEPPCDSPPQLVRFLPLACWQVLAEMQALCRRGGECRSGQAAGWVFPNQVVSLPGWRGGEELEWLTRHGYLETNVTHVGTSAEPTLSFRASPDGRRAILLEASARRAQIAVEVTGA